MCIGCFIAIHSKDETLTTTGLANKKLDEQRDIFLSERFQDNVGGKL